MIKHNYSTTVEVGDTYEFCTQHQNQPSSVHYGKVTKINPQNKTFDFVHLNNGISKKETGQTSENVTAIRRIGYIHGDTWKPKE